jgi:hypothetical protein
MTVAEVELSQRETAPPDFLSEAELIGLMEQYGIGTDASISTHIAAIQDRNFVTLSRGRTLVPTTLGAVLIHGLCKVRHAPFARRRAVPRDRPCASLRRSTTTSCSPPCAQPWRSSLTSLPRAAATTTGAASPCRSCLVCTWPPSRRAQRGRLLRESVPAQV